MGCGSSKGKDGDDDDGIEFKETGCGSIDAFFESAKGVVDALEDLTDPLHDSREEILDLTQFEHIPGAGKPKLIISLRDQARAARYVPLLCHRS